MLEPLDPEDSVSLSCFQTHVIPGDITGDCCCLFHHSFFFPHRLTNQEVFKSFLTEVMFSELPENCCFFFFFFCTLWFILQFDAQNWMQQPSWHLISEHVKQILHVLPITHLCIECVSPPQESDIVIWLLFSFSVFSLAWLLQADPFHFIFAFDCCVMCSTYPYQSVSCFPKHCSSPQDYFKFSGYPWKSSISYYWVIWKCNHDYSFSSSRNTELLGHRPL